jgi:hypothetical protein
MTLNYLVVAPNHRHPDQLTPELVNRQGLNHVKTYLSVEFLDAAGLPGDQYVFRLLATSPPNVWVSSCSTDTAVR